MASKKITSVIVILTQKMDFTVDKVIAELNRKDVPIIRFDTADFPLHSTLNVKADINGWHGSLDYDGRSIPFDNIKSIWFRRPTEFEFNPDMTITERRFASDEARMAIGGLLRSADCLWVNHPEKLVSADYKPLQLKLAVQHGLDIPKTIITNQPDAVVEFYKQCNGQIIYKTLSGGMIFSKRVSEKSIWSKSA